MQWGMCTDSDGRKTPAKKIGTGLREAGGCLESVQSDQTNHLHPQPLEEAAPWISDSSNKTMGQF